MSWSPLALAIPEDDDDGGGAISSVPFRGFKFENINVSRKTSLSFLSLSIFMKIVFGEFFKGQRKRERKKERRGR